MMAECMFCGKPGSDANEKAWHSECHAEHERRRYSGICTKCGERPLISIDEQHWCDTCRISDPFKGYEGFYQG